MEQKNTKQEKVDGICEFCGAELKAISFKGNKEISIYRECDCDKASAISLKKLNDDHLDMMRSAAGIEVWKFEKRGVKERYKNKTLADIVDTTLRKEISDYINGEQDSGIYLIGKCGTGKTLSASIIVNELAKKQIRIVYKTMVDILQDIRSSFDNNENSYEKVKKYFNYEILIIDDLGKEKPTEWAVSTIFEIINSRYENCKTTIVTSNYSDKALINRLTVGNDNTTATAIVDRLYEMTTPVRVTGESQRRK